MKKVFSSATLRIDAFKFAQNDSDVDQTGSVNYATVDQIDANDSFVNQLQQITR